MSPPRFRQNGIALPSLLLLFLLCMALFFYWSHRSSEAEAFKKAQTASRQANQLALGQNARIDAIDIALAPPAVFNGASRQSIFNWRSTQVQRHADLLATTYQPSAEVFGQIADGAPWWGIEGVFLHGPGQRSIEGAAEESRFILNPYLLVAAEFNENAQGKKAEKGRELWCQPHSLRWFAKQRKAEVTYSSRCISQRQTRRFDLIAYNARDLGLGYIYVDYAASMNIGKANAPRTAYANPQYIHKGGSCGYPGGCNNMSPQTPPIDNIEIQALPAKLEILLWHEAPSDVATTPPDLRYRINFE